MQSLIITGALGAGKSTAQETLVRSHGFWTPETITTRPVTGDEAGTVRVDYGHFIHRSLEGRYCLPAQFAGQWYAWRREDLARLIACNGAPAVLNVRPYTALALAALIPNLVPIWLWVEKDELERRLADRGHDRDTNRKVRILRQAHDEEDTPYEDLFQHRVCSNQGMIANLLAIARGRKVP